MSYVTLANVKAYLGIDNSNDDALLTAIIAAAEAQIDSHCGRRFTATTETHYFTLADVEGQVLWLDDELLTVTTLKNGDSAATEITSSYYWLLPRNDSPYDRIRLYSTKSWTTDTDCEISVAGTWGYSTTAPDDIEHACKRLVAYHYRNKDSQVFDVTAMPEVGLLTIPKGLPADVKIMLERYVKRAVA